MIVPILSVVLPASGHSDASPSPICSSSVTAAATCYIQLGERTSDGTKVVEKVIFRVKEGREGRNSRC